jgi:hypothetical protein
MEHTIFLTLHSILRWLVLVFGLLAIIRAVNGLSFKRGYTAQDNKIGMWYTISMDIQVLLGLILYFFTSPITTTALQNFGGAMGNPSARYFLVEHSVLMLLALVVVHVGRVLVRKAPEAASKHRRTAIWFTLSLVMVLAAIPWPFFSFGRPLLRFFGLF